jgi:hypothetical protein
MLEQMNTMRERTKDLRENGLRLLRKIDAKNLSDKKSWVCSGNEAEVALLVKVQNHCNLSRDEKVNNQNQADPELTNKLLKLDLKKLLPDPGNNEPDLAVPVLVAALTLQALTARAQNVFSEASMYCYYRITRELYYAASPDWTIGAARAGRGGRTSAFITGECIQAIQAFQGAVARTVDYLDNTIKLYDTYSSLKAMLNSTGIDLNNSTHPLTVWANHTMERAWLAWTISTSPRNGSIVLRTSGANAERSLDHLDRQGLSLEAVGDSFEQLRIDLINSISTDEKRILEAYKNIDNYRQSEPADIRRRTESAFLTAFKVIENTHANADALLKMGQNNGKAIGIRELLVAIHKAFKSYPVEINRVLESAQRYVRTVLDRELAMAHSGHDFDGGELVFSAAAFGSATNWRPSERLSQACMYLEKALCSGRRLVTHRPFHSDARGYKLLPDIYEMTRCLAKLLHRCDYEFNVELPGKMLEPFTNDKQYVPLSGEYEKCAGWSFENAPEFRKPYVWVTAVSVQALDRIVRLLNHRINETVFKNFKVVRPTSPNVQFDLSGAIYSDDGLSKYYSDSPSIAIRLQQMRAHLMRTSLPAKYEKDQSGLKQKVSSAILYGPPGTGKTSLIEALALNANVPLVMLSPGDLIVQGQEQLESRARDVFAALSMLSQVVILFDEFEPVLRERAPKQEETDSKDHQKPDFNKLVKAISEGSTAMLKFLVTGMLPKLVTLHDAAEKQSLVYCLSTNHLEEIDDAAKRGGRFDVKQPVYFPDPLSRAGTFLFRLESLARKLKMENFLTGKNKQQVFAQIVAATANKNAGDLARCFKAPDVEQKQLDQIFNTDADKNSYFYYVLGNDGHAAKLANEAEEAIEAMGQELSQVKGTLLTEEREEREWLLKVEKQNAQNAISQVNEFSLEKCLTAEGSIT